jgi:hypothetical protein
MKAIEIHPSATADTRTCDVSKVSKAQLYESSVQHIEDVRKGLAFWMERLADAGERHDYDKLTDIASFHADFLTKFEQQEWWTRHRKLNRHHLLQDDGVPSDVNLIDVLDFITDCVMAGMGRAGSVYALDIKPEVLMAAFQNTVELLKSRVAVIPSKATP